MSKVSAFWDSSALTPMCTPQLTTGQARILMSQFSPVVWWSTSVEIHSAIARLYRSGDIDDAGKRVALGQLQVLRDAWEVILAADEVRDRAEALIYRYPLRAADSLQLAAGLVWCRNRPVGRAFISADSRLCEAAEQAGFTVLRP